MAGKTIKLFYVSGEPSGMRVADVMNWAGRAVAIPRALLPAFKTRDEAQRPGVYVLLGDDPEDSEKVRVYVGEAEVLGSRISQHATDEAKSWWTEVAVFTSKDGHLTKAHAKHLERELWRLADAAPKISLANSNEPSGAALPESDLADMEGYLEYVRLVLAPLSPRAALAFEPGSGRGTSGPEFTYKVLEAVARMKRATDGYVVLKGSTAVKKTYDSLGKGYRALREGMLRDGGLAPSGDLFVFSRDTVFSSSSAAACVVAGSSQSGPAGWKLPDGTTLGEFEASELEEGS